MTGNIDFQSLLDFTGLSAWEQFIWDNAPALAAALAGLFLVPFVLGYLPGLGFPGSKAFLKPDTFQDLELVERRELNHNTRWFRFALPHPEQPVGLPVGQHISLRVFGEDGKEISRPYTPVSGEDQLGFVDFVIKIYPKGEMTPLLDALKVGDKVGFRGPKGRMEYRRNMKRAIGMIAGGTGITPMYQVAKAALADPHDNTVMSLIFANVTAGDILLRDELDELAAAHPDRLSVFYVLNECPPGWTGGSGFVSEAMIRERLPAPADDVAVWRCGPPAMNAAVRRHLDAVGYPRDAQFQF
uniref:NADH-cytochrome b5 reductase n=1 Tax=Tetraselmis sp. GSL018 TaxID=582737 RepID=A0A061S6L3_9CHLO